MFANGPEPLQQNDSVEAQLNQLETKLEGFSVLDSAGHLVGKVQELILDQARTLNLVIQKSEAAQGKPILLSSKLIQVVDPNTRTLLTTLNQTEFQSLSEYREPDHRGSEQLSESEAIGSDTILQSPSQTTATQSEVLSEEMIRLLEERLVVTSNKRKVGEVTVRKVIETQTIQVPVRREKLIVEQISPEHKQLVEIDLGQDEDPGVKLADLMSTGSAVVKGEFSSLRAAGQLLEAIASQSPQGCRRVRVELELVNPEDQPTFQAWFDQVSDSR